jgi:hypothetical protein
METLPLFKKRSNQYDWQQEHHNVKQVAGRTFASRTLVVDGGCISSTYGVNLVYAVRTGACNTFVCNVVQSALRK